MFSHDSPVKMWHGAPNSTQQSSWKAPKITASAQIESVFAWCSLSYPFSPSFYDLTPTVITKSCHRWAWFCWGFFAEREIFHSTVTDMPHMGQVSFSLKKERWDDLLELYKIKFKCTSTGLNLQIDYIQSLQGLSINLRDHRPFAHPIQIKSKSGGRCFDWNGRALVTLVLWAIQGQ